MSVLFKAIGTTLLVISILVFLIAVNLIEFIASIDLSPDLMLAIIISLFIGVKIGKRKGH